MTSALTTKKTTRVKMEKPSIGWVEEVNEVDILAPDDVLKAKRIRLNRGVLSLSNFRWCLHEGVSPLA